MKEEQIKDEIILTVKNAIADNADIDVDTDTVTTDCNGVDRLAGQVAEEVYKMFEPVSIDEQGVLGKCGRTENRGQQIKEMQKLICNNCGEIDGCAISCKAHKDLAEAFYNAGYRKTFTSEFAIDTPKAYKEGYEKAQSEWAEKLENGELVGKEWHDEQVLHAESEIERLTEVNKAMENEIYNNEMNLQNLLNEIAELKAENERFESNMKNVLEIEKKNAVKEFAERLKMKTHNYYPSIDSYCISKKAVLVSEIDELLKEYEQ